MVERRFGVVSRLQSILRGGILECLFALSIVAIVTIIADLSIPLSLSLIDVNVGLELGYGDCEAW
jgi:hypothetical protein